MVIYFGVIYVKNFTPLILPTADTVCGHFLYMYVYVYMYIK